MRRLVPALVLIALLAVPSAAAARSGSTNAPAGNSAIDEYLETVPSATGDRVPGGAGGGLTAEQRARLQQLGPDGKILADAIDATGPKSTKSAPAIVATGRAPLAATLDVAAGRGGMGLWLPAILIASLLAIVTLVALRRRSAS